jgi:hypothetical protein
MDSQRPCSERASPFQKNCEPIRERRIIEICRTTNLCRSGAWSVTRKLPVRREGEQLPCRAASSGTKVRRNFLHSQVKSPTGARITIAPSDNVRIEKTGKMHDRNCIMHDGRRRVDEPVQPKGWWRLFAWHVQLRGLRKRYMYRFPRTSLPHCPTQTGTLFPAFGDTY